MAEETAIRGVARQLYYCLKKNTLLQRRYWKSTLTQAVLSPLIILLILYGIQQSVNRSTENLVTKPQARELGPVPNCRKTYRSTKPCITLMFSPASDSRVQNVMNAVVKLNNLRSSSKMTVDTTWTPSTISLPSSSLDAVAVPSESFIYEFAAANPNVTSWAVSFDISPASYDSSVTNYRYQLWYNASLVARNYPVAGAPPFIPGTLEPLDESVTSVIRAIDEAIIATTSGVGTDSNLVNVKMKALPQITEFNILKCPRNPDNVFNQMGPLLLFAPMMVIFFSTANTIASEKERYLKDSMEMIGLKPSIYWLSHYISASVLVLINSIITVFIGYGFGFSLLTKTDLGISFLLFFLLGMSSLSMALFVSSVCQKVRTAIGTSFVVVILSITYIVFGGFASYLWYSNWDDPTATDFTPGWKILILLPAFNYNKLIRDISTYTAKSVGRVGTSCGIIDGTNFGIDQLYGRPKLSSINLFRPDREDLVPRPVDSLWFFFENIVMYAILAWYFDKVVPNDNGYHEHPLFFLMPSFWGFGKKINSSPNRDQFETPPGVEDEDVIVERKDAHTFNDKDSVGLRICNLRKIYQGLIINSGEYKLAVEELSLVLKEGVLGILGSNGAGKTSTMKILYGSSPVSGGTAYIFGLDIRTHMRDIRKFIGVCPQFDVLFPDLSAREHLELFCGIKGIPEEEAKRVSEERLKHMKLWNVREQYAGTYSGGMKRRLSVILATIGDPKCVFLDEPTTGMDPVNKRYVWSFIENFKKGRVIILTTHSMEEADVLANKIAIMTKGRLKGVGTALRLKNKFGTGYRISLIIPRARDVPAVKDMILSKCPEATVEEEEYIGATGVQKIGETKKSSKEDVSGIDENAQTARVVIAVTNIATVKTVVKILEDNQRKHAKEKTVSLISGWGMSQTSLEDVFLKMIRP